MAPPETKSYEGSCYVHNMILIRVSIRYTACDSTYNRTCVGDYRLHSKDHRELQAFLGPTEPEGSALPLYYFLQLRSCHLRAQKSRDF
jgi:hypothetical protein